LPATQFAQSDPTLSGHNRAHRRSINQDHE
jgi:hypothetical protein